MDWDTIKTNLSGNTKQRLQGLDVLLAFIAQNQLDRDFLHDLVDVSNTLLNDHNYKVSATALQALAAVVEKEKNDIKPFANVLVPMAAERLADGRQQVRLEACGLLLTMFKYIQPAYLLERMTRYWTHKHWKVRHGILQTIAEAIADCQGVGFFTSKDQNDYLLTQVVNLVEDPDSAVRDAAMECLQEFYKVQGTSLVDNLQSQNIRSAVFRQMITRLNEICPTNIALPETSTGSRKQSRETREFDTASTADMYTTINNGSGSSKLQPGGSDGAPTLPDGGKQPAARRGGYKDGGGLDVQGVAPIYVASDRELVGELEALQGLLASTAPDWQQRIAGMVKVEGLIRGAAGNPGLVEVFVDAFKVLKEPMVRQLEDRRSAVEKQACRTLVTISQVLGVRFQDYLLCYLPVLFKLLPITVQVMADAAEQCCRLLLTYCQVARAIPVVIQTVTKDKNTKIRQFCSIYLVQILEEWDPAVYQKHLDDIEAAMKTAAQDANSETRQSARNMFTAYSAAFPESSAAFLRRLEPSVQDKLSKAPKEKKVSTFQKPFSRPSSAQSLASSAADSEIIILAPPYKQSSAPAPMAPPSVAEPRAVQSHRGPSKYGAAPPEPPPQDMRPKTERGSRKSFAFGPSRVPGGTLPEVPLGDSGNLTQLLFTGLESHAKPPGGTKARRTSCAAVLAVPRAAQATPAAKGPAPPVPRTVSSPVSSSSHFTEAGGLDYNAPLATLSGSQGGGIASRHSASGSVAASARPMSAWREAEPTPPMKPAAAIKSAASTLSVPKVWNEKVEALQLLADAVRQLSGGDASSSYDPQRDLEKLAPKLVECMEDPHHKVVGAAMEAFREGARLCSRAYESSIDRVIPILFKELGNQKDQIRSLASDILQECTVLFNADILMTALSRTLDNSKVTKSRTAVLEYAASQIGLGRPAGNPTNPNSTRNLLQKAAVLLSDKALDVKKKAVELVEALYRNVDANVVVMYAQHTTGAEGVLLRRMVGSFQEASQEAAPASQVQSSASQLYASSRPPQAASGATGTAYSMEGHRVADAAPAASGSATHTGSAATRPGYCPTNYISPIKSDPAMLARIGPIVDPVDRLNACSDPGASTAAPPASSYSLTNTTPSTSIPSTSSVTASGASIPRSVNSLSSGGGSNSGQTNPYLVVHNPAPSSAGFRSSSASGAVVSSLPEPQQPQMPALDLAAQNRALSLLTVRLQSAPSDSSLDALIRAVDQYSSTAWETSFGTIISFVITRTLKSPEEGIREASLELIKRLACVHPKLFKLAVFDVVVMPLLAATGDVSKEVMIAAIHALDHLMDIAPYHKAVDILAAALPGPGQHPDDLDSKPLCNAIRCLQRVVRKMPSEELMARVPVDLMPRLDAAAQHVAADVRKATFYCIAQMWHQLGDRFDQYLNDLQHVQRSLVVWSLSRVKKAAGVC